MANVRIRPADLARLTEIYNHYVVTSAVTFDLEPLTVDQRAAWFEEHSETGRHRLLVADEDGLVVGYASTSRFRARAAYYTTVEASILLCAAFGWTWNRKRPLPGTVRGNRWRRH
jgi:phosphinothricin acetyltransferase